MESGTNLQQQCPLPEISSYLDGELGYKEEAALDGHFSLCSICSQEMLEQKRFLNSLGASLNDDLSFELPRDFSKRIIKTAENNVSGLSGKRDILISAIICVFLLTLVGISSHVNGIQISGGLLVLIESTSALAKLSLVAAYNISYGLTVILRSFTQNEAGIITTASIIMAAAAGMIFFGYFRSTTETDSSSKFQKQ